MNKQLIDKLTEDHRGRKPVLTKEQVADIENLITLYPTVILTRIAEEYGVSRATISKIRTNLNK